MTEETKTDAKPATAESAERPSAIPPDEMARLTDEIVGALKTVYDPEIPADIYELGLIYKVDIDDDRMVKIDMTLTTPNCPSAAELPMQVENAVAGVPGVRVCVKNGGCAGMSYIMEYAEKINPLDEVVEDKGVRILIDPKAVLFLLGTEMDYRIDKLSAQFVFNNPNQTAACGCGESVQLKPAAQAQ